MEGYVAPLYVAQSSPFMFTAHKKCHHTCLNHNHLLYMYSICNFMNNKSGPNIASIPSREDEKYWYCTCILDRGLLEYEMDMTWHDTTQHDMGNCLGGKVE